MRCATRARTNLILFSLQRFAPVRTAQRAVSNGGLRRGAHGTVFPGSLWCGAPQRLPAASSAGTVGVQSACVAGVSELGWRGRSVKVRECSWFLILAYGLGWARWHCSTGLGVQGPGRLLQVRVSQRMCMRMLAPQSRGLHLRIYFPGRGSICNKGDERAHARHHAHMPLSQQPRAHTRAIFGILCRYPHARDSCAHTHAHTLTHHTVHERGHALQMVPVQRPVVAHAGGRAAARCRCAPVDAMQMGQVQRVLQVGESGAFRAYAWDATRSAPPAGVASGCGMWHSLCARQLRAACAGRAPRRCQAAPRPPCLAPCHGRAMAAAACAPSRVPWLLAGGWGWGGSCAQMMAHMHKVHVPKYKSIECTVCG